MKFPEISKKKQVVIGIVLALLVAVLGWVVELSMLHRQTEVWVSGPVSAVHEESLEIQTRHEKVTVTLTPETTVMLRRQEIVPADLLGRFVSAQGLYRADGVFEALFIRVLEPHPYAE